MMMTAGSFPMPVCSPDYVPHLVKVNRLEAGTIRLCRIFGELAASVYRGWINGELERALEGVSTSASSVLTGSNVA